MTWSPAEQHLRRDPRLRALLDAGGPIESAADRRGSRKDAYEALARAIVGQQLSTKAAASIWARFAELFGGGTPAPAELIEIEPQRLRDAGLSWAKAAYRLDLAGIAELDDEAVVAELTRIKGVGRWTAEMFLMFHLGRPDVLSVGDLGIRRATQLAYGLDDLPAPAELERIAERWRPHRTLACMYLWRSLDNAPD